MKKKDFTRLIDTVFAVTSEEMVCTHYFDELPKYVELEVAEGDAATRMPEVRHHMHQCPECEEVYLALLDLVRDAKTSNSST